MEHAPADPLIVDPSPEGPSLVGPSAADPLPAEPTPTEPAPTEPGDNPINFFNLDNAKRVAEGLDFIKTSRISRDGSVKIHLHSKINPDELAKYQIFDLCS